MAEKAAAAPAQVADAVEAPKSFSHNGYKYGLESSDERVAPMKVALISPLGNVLDYFESEKAARTAVEDDASPARLAQNRVG